MLGASYGPVGDIEILWTLIAVIGLVFSLYNIREGRLDRKILAELGIANGRAYIARISLISEVLRAAKQAFFLLVGIFAMLLPQMDTSAAPLKLVIFSALFRWGLIIASVIVSFQSYLSYKVRKHVTED